MCGKVRGLMIESVNVIFINVFMSDSLKYVYTHTSKHGMMPNILREPSFQNWLEVQ